MAAVQLILRVTFSMFGKFSDLKSGIVRRNIMKKFYFFYLQSTPYCVRTLFFSYFGNLNKTSFYTKASAQTALNLHSFRNMNNLNPWSKSQAFCRYPIDDRAFFPNDNRPEV